MAKLLLAGYFGCGNLGDDAILVGFSDALGNRPHEITVLSGAPEDTYRYHKLHSVQRRDMRAVGEAIKACDAIVFPGGSIFQDVTSSRSVYYYLSLVKQAKAAGKKVILLGQGVGPLNSFMGKRWAATAFKMADAIAVRDPGSMTTLKNLGVEKSITVAADTAFLLPPPFQEEENQAGFQVGSMTTAGIAARPFGKGNAIAELFGETARLLFQNNYMPVLIEMDHKEDGPLIQDINTRNGGKVPDLRKQGRPQQIQTRLARMDAIIAVRLHAGILAATVGVPALMVSYDPKVTAFAKLMDLPCLPLEGLTPTRLFEAFKETMANRAKIVERMEPRRAQQVELARKNIALLDLVLGDGRKA